MENVGGAAGWDGDCFEMDDFVLRVTEEVVRGCVYFSFGWLGVFVYDCNWHSWLRNF